MNQSTEKDEISFSQGQIIWNYIFLSILVLLIILNNVLILTTVLSQRRLQSQINIIVIGSMAVAQLLGGLLAIPFNMALVQDYQDDNRLDFARVAIRFCGVASQLHLTVLCGDRYLALCDSVTYGNLKRGFVAIAVVITWFLSIFASVLSLLDFKNYSVFLVITFFLLPWLFDVIGYTLTYRSLEGESQTTLLRKELRLANWFAIMTLVCSLLWFPFVVTSLLREHCASCDTSSSALLLFVLYFQLFSLTFSSLIYYNGSLDFRLAFKIIGKELRNLVGKKHDRDEDTPQGSLGHDGKPKHDGVVNQTNMVMFLNEEGRSGRNTNSTVRHSFHEENNGLSMAPKEDVHIVPFDQARFFGKNEQGEELSNEKEAGDLPSFDDLDVEQDSKKELGFNDIEIVPYDQSC